MKKIIKITSLLVAILIGFVACNEDYFDVNTPADSVDVDQLGMKDLMGPVLYNTMIAQYSASTGYSNYSQYIGGYGYSALGRSTFSGAWNSVYLSVLPNVRIIKQKAIDLNATKYEAVAMIVEAANMGLAADTWDAVPYSQAVQPSAYPKPNFDAQETVYNEIFKLLDQAIVKLEGTDDSGYNLGSEDLIYGGNYDKWLRAAYTLKARYQLHLLKRGKATTADILTNLSKGFVSNADNFVMNYPTDKLNPWYQNTILTRNTGNYFEAPCDQLISMMNGKYYPFESGSVTEDPRLPAIFDKTNPADPWRGGLNGGNGESSDGLPLNTYFKDGGYYTSATAPLVMITFAEALFIKAEAHFLAGGGTSTSSGADAAAYDAYKLGIAASMAQFGVSGGAYLADTSVDVGAENLELNHIMKEKYIANILNSETYNDFRRYNFSTDVFKGLQIRLGAEAEDPEFAGQWFKRGDYPVSERNANPDVVAEFEESPVTPVWWAQ
ncbi:MAG: SusD/RagB family nutrient-binding outer membrane lipoprotein [Flavobacteriaceae bacterium]|nr:SusD/RagB family nutrient-binding outer membrane lipoprotein [Flavobacteriaceae bacterium]